MNIFVLDTNIEKCAQYHCDKHVIKMILEYAQLLCSVHHKSGTNAHTIPYRLTHPNHPAAIWARQSIQNYNWLCNLAIALCDEYYIRYGKIKNKQHASRSIVEWAILNPPQLPTTGLTAFVSCMPDEYIVGSTVDNYRNYYNKSKSRFATWKTQVPEWFKGSK